MDEELKATWIKILAEHEKKRRRIMPMKRNQLALWLGRLVIEYNQLEHSLTGLLASELVEMIAGNEDPIGHGSTSHLRAMDGNLREIMMATISFRQKIDVLVAILYKKFADNEQQLKHIDSIVGLMCHADDYRNRMVHSVWLEAYDQFSRVKPNVKGRKGLRLHKDDADIKEIKNAVGAIGLVEFLCRHCLRSPQLANKYNPDYNKIRLALNPPAKVKPITKLFLHQIETTK